MPFQFNSKSIFATYAKCYLNVDDVIKHFQLLGINKYVIGTEAHEDGSPHFHIYAQWPVAFRTKDERAFDIGGYHPHVQNPRNRQACIDYCKKDGNTLSNFDTDDDSSWGQIAQIQDDPDRFLSAVKRHFPRDFVLSRERLDYYVEKQFKKPKREYSSEFTEFSCPIDVDAWVEENIGRSVGEGGRAIASGGGLRGRWPTGRWPVGRRWPSAAAKINNLVILY